MKYTKAMSKSQELNKLNIAESLNGIKDKKFSIRELVSDCLKTAKEKNKNINSYLEIYEGSAFEEAKRMDEATGDFNDLPPLWGIPFAIKDNILIDRKIASAA